MMTRLVSLACVFTLGGLLAGCGADGASDSGAGAGDPAVGRAADTSAKAAVAEGKSATTNSSSVTARLVRTAQITVAVKDVDRAAATVRTTAVTFGGLVSNETTGYQPQKQEDENNSGTGEDPEAKITLRVPEPKMDDALDRVAGLGQVRDRSTSSEDVTATIADLDSRVGTQTRSVARVRDLLDQAKSLNDIVLLETELARRESDLEAVQARQRALADQAALATITVILRTPDAVVIEADEAGFLVGLKGGWTALKVSTTAVVTVLGAVLPIAVVLAAIGIPAYLIRRRLSHPPTAPRPEPGPDPATP
jgi:hypothetical protein